MNVGTSIEQSKKLVEVGIDSGTADMCWLEGEQFTEKHGYDEERAKSHREVGMEYLPSWSLSALFKLIPYTFSFESNNLGLYRCLIKGIHGTDIRHTPIDAAFDMVVWLKENKYI